MFRQYDRVVYMDADTIVQHRIDPLFDVIMPPNVTIIMRENGAGIHKGSLYKTELTGDVPIADTLSPGGCCLMIINMHALPAPGAMAAQLRRTLNKYHKFFRHADQSLLNVVFRTAYNVMWPCVHDIRVVDPSTTVQRGWAYKICGDDNDQGALIVSHDYRRQCLN